MKKVQELKVLSENIMKYCASLELQLSRKSQVSAKEDTPTSRCAEMMHPKKPHRKSHHYKCITCDKGFCTAILLAQHKQAVLVGIKFNCDHPQCNKSFDIKNGLKMQKYKMSDTFGKLFFSTSEV